MLKVSSNNLSESRRDSWPGRLSAARDVLLGPDAYIGYSYSYPHKTAYRRLDPAVPLRSVWEGEDVKALSLYVHVPFCSSRCGYCNLLSMSNPPAELVTAYLTTLGKQIKAVAEALPPGRKVARLAFGGGTPTFLDVAAFDQIFALLGQHLGVNPEQIPSCVEVSAHSADRPRLASLRARGIDRISLGVQSFNGRDAKALGRPQSGEALHRALGLVRDLGFSTLNVDLIYGAEGQTLESWLLSIEAALQYQPEEIYLYPLYVRHLTGLGRRDGSWNDIRAELYRRGREMLCAAGYVQRSMRMFESRRAPACSGPEYCCQEDDMVGLGPGARSYTQALHYATEYAVGRGATRELIRDFANLGHLDLSQARYGIRLDPGEQRRRYVIKSLLRAEGLSNAGYEGYFGTPPLDDLPDLRLLPELGLASRTSTSLKLTELGLERSDAIGPWLYSARVLERMEAYHWR